MKNGTCMTQDRLPKAIAQEGWDGIKRDSADDIRPRRTNQEGWDL